MRGGSSNRGPCTALQYTWSCEKVHQVGGNRLRGAGVLTIIETAKSRVFNNFQLTCGLDGRLFRDLYCPLPSQVHMRIRSSLHPVHLLALVLAVAVLATPRLFAGGQAGLNERTLYV